MTWLGVGNVEGRLVRSGDTQVVSLPTRRASPVTSFRDSRRRRWTSGSVTRCFFATDGVAARFAETTRLSGSTRELADRVLAEHAKPTDDALVVVARYLGSRP